MAEFNPFPPQPNIPDWTNAPGRLIDGSGLGEIFGKVTQNVSGIYKAEKDRSALDTLYNSADAAADEGRTESMAEAAGIPVDVARAMDKAELMKKAFASGRFSEATFYHKMGVWSKEMRVRYPQYKDVIDQQLGRVMGRTPANLEMDAVRTKMEAEQNALSSAKNEEYKFLEEAAEKGWLSPGEVSLFEQAGAGSEIRSRLRTKALLFSSAMAEQKASLEVLKNNSAAGALEAAPSLALGTSNLINSHMSEAISAAGGTYSSFNDMLGKMAEGGYSGDELAAIVQEGNRLTQSLDAGWNQLISTPLEGGKSYVEYFASDMDTLNKQKQRIDDIKAAVKAAQSGDTGALRMNGIIAEASLDARVRQLKGALGDDFVDGIAAARKILGSEVVDQKLLEMTQGGDDPISAMIQTMMTGIAYKGGDPFGAINKVADAADPSMTNQVNKAARSVIETKLNLATDSSLPVAAREAEMRSLLSPEGINFFRRLKDTPDNTGLSSREKFYKHRLLDPKFAAAAKELGMEKEYLAKVKEFGVALAATNIEEANATNVNTELADISFNPETMRYEMRLNKGKVKAGDEGKIAGWLKAKRQNNGTRAWSEMPANIPLSDLDALANGADAIQKLNMVTEGLIMALKAETPGISDEELGKQIQQYLSGLKTNYGKVGTWWDRAIKAVSDNSIFTGGLEKGKKQNQKDLQGEDFGAVPLDNANFDVAQGSSGLADDDAAAILSFVSKAEGADFNTLFGGSKVILEEKTVAEVQQLQRAHGKKTGSSATGAYQVMRKTLSDLIDQGVVDPDEPFTEDVQNRIGMALLERRGYADWKAGKITTEQFANRLAQEWAALPTASGKSAYDGVMGNKATVKRRDVVAMLEGLKT